MRLTQYRYFGESDLSNVTDLNNLNGQLTNLIGTDIIKKIKVQALPSTKIYLSGNYIGKEEEPQIENTTIDVDAEIVIDENAEEQNEAYVADDMLIVENQETLANTVQQPEVSENENKTPYLLVGGTGIFELDLFSWNTHFMLNEFKIVEDLIENEQINLNGQFGIIVNIESYPKNLFSDPYSEMWIDFDEIVADEGGNDNEPND